MAVYLFTFGVMVGAMILGYQIKCEKTPPRCLRCGRMLGDGSGVLHQWRVEKTCTGVHKRKVHA